MDDFYEYWELIPDFEKYEKVGKVSSATLTNKKKIFNLMLQLLHNYE